MWSAFAVTAAEKFTQKPFELKYRNYKKKKKMAELIHKDLNKMQLQSFPPTSTLSLAKLYFLFVKNGSIFWCS